MTTTTGTTQIDHRSYRTPLLRFPCAKCGARAGEECRAASGRITYDQHAARYAAEAAYYESFGR